MIILRFSQWYVDTWVHGSWLAHEALIVLAMLYLYTVSVGAMVLVDVCKFLWRVFVASAR